MSERDVFLALAGRYAHGGGNGPKWALIPQVRNGAGWGGALGIGGLRTCDAMALGLWGSTGHALIGHEIKCSRSDWLRELKAPWKADAFRAYCAEWWLVAPPDVARPEEIPPGWGLLAASDRGTRVVLRAQKLTPEPMPLGLIVALTRAAIRGGVLGGEPRVLPSEAEAA